MIDEQRLPASSDTIRPKCFLVRSQLHHHVSKARIALPTVGLTRRAGARAERRFESVLCKKRGQLSNQSISHLRADGAVGTRCSSPASDALAARQESSHFATCRRESAVRTNLSALRHPRSSSCLHKGTRCRMQRLHLASTSRDCRAGNCRAAQSFQHRMYKL